MSRRYRRTEQQDREKSPMLTNLIAMLAGSVPSAGAGLYVAGPMTAAAQPGKLSTFK